MEIVFLPGGGAARFLARGFTLGGSFFASAGSTLLSGFCGVLKLILILYYAVLLYLSPFNPFGFTAGFNCARTSCAALISSSNRAFSSANVADICLHLAATLQ